MTLNFNLLSDRINYCLETFRVTKSELSRIAGVKPASVSDWLSGKSKGMRADAALRIAAHFKISPYWLATGAGLPEQEDVVAIDDTEPIDPDNYVQIKEYTINFAGGPGSEPDYEELVTSVPVTYRLSWFQERGINYKHCKRFTVSGTSMEPLLYAGDKITVDLNDCVDIRSGHVYALIIENELKVKKLVKQINGNLIIRSVNPEYPDEILTKDDINVYIKIIGRVVDKSGSGGL